MYALHDVGAATSVLPLPQPSMASADQLERRAVESSERGSLTTDEKSQRHYSSSAAVLELVERSAKSLDEILAVADERTGEVSPAGPDAGLDAGGQVDIYA